MRECSGGACASGVADAQRRRRRYVSVMARMRGSDGAVVCEWCRRCARVVSQVRSCVGIDARVWGWCRSRCARVVSQVRRYVSVAGRLCASGVAGAREMVAAGKTKLMHSLFPIRFVFSHFSEKNRNEHQ